MTECPEWMTPESFESWKPFLEAPVPVVGALRHGVRPVAATSTRGEVAATGSIPEPEFVDLYRTGGVELDDLVLIGVAWYRVGLAVNGSRLVLEGPINSQPEGSLL